RLRRAHAAAPRAVPRPPRTRDPSADGRHNESMTDPAPVTAPGAEWNARAYNRLNNPMQAWGEAVVKSLSLRGNETALDLGCGSGRLTEFLARRLPLGQVIAIDRSANMLAAARAHLEPAFGRRVEYLQASLDELEMDQV